MGTKNRTTKDSLANSCYIGSRTHFVQNNVRGSTVYFLI